MRTRLAPRLAGSMAGIALLLAIGAPVAIAKEGVEVALAAPISPDAQPGETVDVHFTLAAISETGTSPLSGSDVFIRLYGPTGAMTQAAGVAQARAGTYKAMVAIPAGGAARAEFGLHGTATDASGKPVASDIIWPYDGILVAAKVPSPVKPQTDPAAGTKPVNGAQPAAGTPAAGTQPATSGTTASGGAFDLPVLLAAGAAAGLALTAVTVIGRGRRLHASPA